MPHKPLKSLISDRIHDQVDSRLWDQLAGYHRNQRFRVREKMFDLLYDPLLQQVLMFDRAMDAEELYD